MPSTVRSSKSSAALIRSLLDQCQHVPIDVRAVGVDFIDRRTGQCMSFEPRVIGPDGLVVRVEEVCKPRMEWLVARVEGAEQKCLEKPRNVSEMPFRRARLRDALHLVVVDSERCAKRLAERASQAILGRRDHRDDTGGRFESGRLRRRRSGGNDAPECGRSHVSGRSASPRHDVAREPLLTSEDNMDFRWRLPR